MNQGNNLWAGMWTSPEVGSVNHRIMTHKCYWFIQVSPMAKTVSDLKAAFMKKARDKKKTNIVQAHLFKTP